MKVTADLSSSKSDQTRAAAKSDLIVTPACALTETSILHTVRQTHKLMDIQADSSIPPQNIHFVGVYNLLELSLNVQKTK